MARMNRLRTSLFAAAALAAAPLCAATVSAISLATVALPTGPAAASELAAAIIYNGTKNDSGFNQMAFEGTERAATDFNVRFRERVTADAADTEKALRTFADAGMTYLLTIGFANTEAVETVAKDYPNVNFTIIDGFIPDMPNVRSVLFAEQEAGYLAGVAAASKSKTGHLGLIGALDIPPIRKFFCGFSAGATAVNPEARFTTVYYGEDGRAFRDRNKAGEIAKAMIADGADVIFPAAGLAGDGAAAAAKEAGVLAIGVDSNQNGLIPGTMLTSALKRVDQAAYLTWKDATEGTWTAGVVRLGAAEQGVDWAVDVHNEALVSDIRARVEEAKAGLVSGAITITPDNGVEGCAEVLG